MKIHVILVNVRSFVHLCLLTDLKASVVSLWEQLDMAPEDVMGFLR